MFKLNSYIVEMTHSINNDDNMIRYINITDRESTQKENFTSGKKYVKTAINISYNNQNIYDLDLWDSDLWADFVQAAKGVILAGEGQSTLTNRLISISMKDITDNHILFSITYDPIIYKNCLVKDCSWSLPRYAFLELILSNADLFYKNLVSLGFDKIFYERRILKIEELKRLLIIQQEIP